MTKEELLKNKKLTAFEACRHNATHPDDQFTKAEVAAANPTAGEMCWFDKYTKGTDKFYPSEAV